VRSKQADEAERRRITVAKEAAGGSEQQGVLDGNQGRATFIKLGRQEAIGTADGSGSPRRLAIGAENGADVLFAEQASETQICRPLAVGVYFAGLGAVAFSASCRQAGNSAARTSFW